MEETWVDIKGYEGVYQVSNAGRFRSLDGSGANNEQRTTKDIDS